MNRKPLTSSNFAIAQAQVVLFTPDEEISAAKLLKGLVVRWVDLFDADPLLLPAPDGAPRALPRLILRSKTGDWRCQVSSERLDVFWQRTGEAVPFPGLSKALSLLQEYRTFLGARVARLAAVLTRFAPAELPGLVLARHFCTQRWSTAPLNRPENFELHAHKRFMLGGRFMVNSWVRNKTATASSGSAGERSIVLVEQDLNTLAEDIASRDFSQDEIGAFFQAAESEFDTILGLYYPSGEPS
ncbi:MAG: hypothetical protein HYW06_03375 [Gemmatimonadetes bacterium]|nr:hypothetical protein [Gemmatimonadota bacterium]MBI2536008.1 hypothetical protein [Gemmatimonadota bacterium]